MDKWCEDLIFEDNLGSVSGAGYYDCEFIFYKDLPDGKMSFWDEEIILYTPNELLSFNSYLDSPVKELNYCHDVDVSLQESFDFSLHNFQDDHDVMDISYRNTNYEEEDIAVLLPIPAFVPLLATRDYVNWSDNSCFIDNWWELLFRFWLRWWREIYIENEFFIELFTYYASRLEFSTKNTELKVEYHKYVCSRLKDANFGDYYYILWLTDILDKINFTSTSLLTLCHRHSCLVCDPGDKSSLGTVFLNSESEIFGVSLISSTTLKSLFNDICCINQCKRRIYQKYPPLAIIPCVSTKPMEKVKVCESFEFGRKGVKYNLSAVITSTTGTGTHFLSYFRFENNVLLFDALQKDPTTSLDGWPEYFKYPCVLIFEIDFDYCVNIDSKNAEFVNISEFDSGNIDIEELTKGEIHMEVDEECSDKEYSDHAENISKGNNHKRKYMVIDSDSDDDFMVKENVKSDKSKQHHNSKTKHSMNSKNCNILELFKLSYRATRESVLKDIIDSDVGKFPLEAFISEIDTNNAEDNGALFISGVDSTGKSTVIHYLSNYVDDNSSLETVVDIDSILFSTATLETNNTDMELIVFPLFENSLKSNNSLCWKYQGEDIPLFRIPNIHFGKVGMNNMFNIHLMFPGLIRKVGCKWVNVLTNDQTRHVFDDIVLPAIKKILPIDTHKEFQLYDTNSANARTSKGTYTQRSVSIHSSYINQILTEMRTITDNNPSLKSFRGFFYHIHGKNLKLKMRSSLGETKERLFTKYNVFDWKQYENDLYIDIGIEYLSSLRNLTLVWDMRFVVHFLRSIYLKNINEHNWLLNTYLGGASARTIPEKSSLSDIVFCQFYLAEKNTLYSFGNNSGVKNFSPQDLVGNTRKFMNCCDSMSKAWENDKIANLGIRVEFRVKFTSRNIVRQLFEDASSFKDYIHIYAFPSQTVAEYKMKSLKVLTSLSNSVLTWNLSHEDCSLVQSYLYMLIKALISRPEPQYLTKFMRLFQMKDYMKSFNRVVTDKIDIKLKEVTYQRAEEIKDVEFIRKKIRHARNISSRQRLVADNQSEDICLNDFPAFCGKEVTPQHIFNQFIKSLWLLFPAPNTHLKSSINFDEPPELNKESLDKNIRCWDVSKSRVTWDARFEWYFPPPGAPVVYERSSQGWRSLEYMNEYNAWVISNHAGRQALRDLFNNLAYLPKNTPKDKLWTTKRSKKFGTTAVWFVEREV